MLRWLYHLLFFVTIIFVINSCSETETETLPEKYSIQYIGKAIVIDGEVNETQWENTNWSDPFVDIEGFKKPLPHYQTRIKMLWDKYYLYIAAEIEEPHLWATLTERDAIIYRDNDFEVFIDPDGDGLNYYELEINAFGTVFDLFLEKPYSKKGKANISWNFEGLKSAVSLQGSLNNPVDIDTSWTVEIAIPWKSFSANDGIPPENGDQWRINFSRVQWDLEIETYVKVNKPEHNWVWSPQGKVNMHIPEKWGLVKFIGRANEELALSPKFWVWMGADKTKSNSDWDSTFRAIRAAGISGILMSSDTTILNKIIPIANHLDMEVHAWFWTMNMADANPEWMSVNRLGQSLADEIAYVEYYKFMCPAIPEVGTFIKNKMEDLVRIKGLKGIHMDYIRYVDVILPVGLWDKYGLVQDHIMPEFDYGYHPYMRNLFKEKYGYDPFEIENVAHNSLWVDFRLTELNKTVIRLRDFVNSTSLNISSAVFPTPEISKEMVRQDWGSWGLDYYFPMVYHNFYEEDINWIRKVMIENKSVVSPESKVFCGLFLPVLKNGNDLTLAMQAAFDGGADGIAFFDLNALTENHLEQISKFR